MNKLKHHVFSYLSAILSGFLILFLSIPAHAQDQLVSIGFKGGIPFTDALSLSLIHI